MNQVPHYIPLVFILTTGLAFFIFYKARKGSFAFIYVLAGWLLIQAVLALTGFYQVVGGGLSRFFLLITLPLVCVALVFLTTRGRQIAGQFDLKWLTVLHTTRIPVELIFFWLFIHNAVPRVMTFEGRNFDILAGLTAPLIYYFGFVKNRLPVKVVLAWNFISIGLLLNVVAIAVLSMPFPTQQFGFGQPDIALFYFPYIWLPGFVVPIVIFAHLESIRQLLIQKERCFKKLQIN